MTVRETERMRRGAQRVLEQNDLGTMVAAAPRLLVDA